MAGALPVAPTPAARGLWVSVGVLAALAIVQWLLYGDRHAGVPAAAVPPLEAVFFAVGHGDATLVRSGGEALLVDGGGVEAGPILLRLLAQWGVRSLAAIVVTEPDPDHAGALPAVLARLPVGWLGGSPRALLQAEPLAVLEAAARHGVPYRVLWAGSSWSLGSARVDILYPPEPADGATAAGTLVVRVQAGLVRLLLPGDLDAAEEQVLLRLHPELEADVLRVPGQGRQGYASRHFLGRLRPRVAVIGVGRYNEEGLPHPDVLSRLAGSGAAVFRTDVAGTVTIRTPDGRSLVVVPERGSPRRFSARGP